MKSPGLRFLPAVKLAAACISYLVVAVSPSVLSAQAVSLNYAQTIVPTGLQYLYVVKLDNAGKIYLEDEQTTSMIYSVPPGGGTPVAIAPAGYHLVTVDGAGNAFEFAPDGVHLVKVPAGGGAPVTIGNFTRPHDVALDQNGNVYVIDITSSNPESTILWKLAAEGAGAQTQVTIPQIDQASQLAADLSGNVYVYGTISTTSASSLVEIPANGGAQVLISLPPNIDLVVGFAVDSAGNIFYGDPPNSSIKELTVIQGSPNTRGGPVQLGGGLIATSGETVDAQNNVYLADYAGLFELQRTGSVSFGNVNACAAGQTTPAPCSETATLYYNVTTSGTLGTPRVVTSASDFALVSGGTTCTGTVTAGSTCTVEVSFTPAAAGLRSGSIQIVNGSGTVLATTPVSGNGVANATITAITGQTPGSLRNNYSGLVGFAFTTGSNPVQISLLGRYVAPGDSGTHLLKLVQANGVDVPGGSATVTTAGAPSGQYAYAALASPIALPPNTTDYLVSQETAGGDPWYDYGPVTSTTDLSVLGPTYTDSSGHYITVNDFSASYVPLNFLYTPTTGTALSVSITSPATGALLSGTASVVVSTTGSVAALQLQVDGSNDGPGVPVTASQGPTYTLSLDTTALVNGSHTLTVVASDAQSNTSTSSPVTVSVNNASGTGTSFVTGQPQVNLRNNYSGFVGFSMTTGSAPISVSYLGRYVTSGNSGTHLLKLVNSNGTDVAGGSVSVSLAAATAGTFSYAALSSPISLQANTTYFLVSQETAGGDQWNDLRPVMTTSVATVTAPVYTDGSGHYVPVSGYSGYSYVPVSFLYGGSALSATITSPQAGAVVSGASVPVTVSTTGSFTSLQLKVDGVSQGAAVASSPLTLNTTTLSNGSHTLTVLIANGASGSALSAGVIVTVNNGGATVTALITGETPSSLRNNYSGFVGTAIEVGSSPLSVTSLGRYAVSGNTGQHTLKLVQANGTDVPGGTVTVNAAGATPGQFVYVTLPSPVALLANTTYYLLSQETAGGDQWYNFEPVTATSAVQIAGPVYMDGHGNYVLVGGLPGNSYVPVSLQYQ